MPTEEDLEQMTTEQMDRERVKDKILAIEIETLKKGLGQIENVSGLSGV